MRRAKYLVDKHTEMGDSAWWCLNCERQGKMSGNPGAAPVAHQHARTAGHEVKVWRVLHSQYTATDLNVE